MSIPYKTFFLFLAAVCCLQCTGRESAESDVLPTQVLVVGGGTGGTAAAIQAARLGAKVIMVEPSPWLGGMLTAAGVSATDGNHRLPSGLWGEFRQHLYEHYGGPKEVATGWVSNTLFEPSVGNKIWNQMADRESNLRRIHGYRVTRVLKENNRVTTVIFKKTDEEAKPDSLVIQAQITIDATELGDAMALAGADYYTGQDPQSLTGEPSAPDEHNPSIQDLTYVAILKDYGPGTDHTLPKPEDYDPSEFNCMCAELCDDPNFNGVNCDQMLEYGRLPGNKFMINWPNQGNDYYVNAIDMTWEDRGRAYEAAKQTTLNWIYYLQTEGGYKNLGLAQDEFPTDDHLALIPYHREGRRLKGMAFLTVNDLEKPYRSKLYQSAIAVGDYPLDHHHKKNPEAALEEFPDIPSFSIPYGSLVPEKIDGLLAGEKNISVSHLANGATRLQPCVILTGQAAGAAAALCVKENIQPRELQVRSLQQVLLDADCWLLPFIDTTPADWYFQPLQKMGVYGVLKGHGVPYQWANQTWIYPDSAVSESQFLAAVAKARNQSNENTLSNNEPISRSQAVVKIWDLLDRPDPQESSNSYQDVSDQVELVKALAYFREKGWTQHWAEDGLFHPQEVLKRKELAYLISEVFDPFGRDIFQKSH